MPIALTIHHPALASHMANAPPNAIAATPYHHNVEERAPTTINKANTKAKPIAIIPVIKRANLPFAPILHSIFSTPQSQTVSKSRL